MITVSFFLGCRECHSSDNIEHLYMLMDGDYEKYLKKTEFEVMTQIEQWREEENKKCDFCGSSNVEIFDVKINGTPLYNYEYLINSTLTHL